MFNEPPMTGNGSYLLKMVMTGGWFMKLFYPHCILNRLLILWLGFVWTLGLDSTTLWPFRLGKWWSRNLQTNRVSRQTQIHFRHPKFFKLQEWRKSWLISYLMGWLLPSGRRLHNYGTSPFSIGKSTISMAIFNSKPLNYQRITADSFRESRLSTVRGWRWERKPVWKSPSFCGETVPSYPTVSHEGCLIFVSTRVLTLWHTLWWTNIAMENHHF